MVCGGNRPRPGNVKKNKELRKMKKFIPYEKLAKREKRARDRAARRDWGRLSPVTRTSENPKAYDRAKVRRDEESRPDFSFLGNVV
jgi:hypothetical protein